MADIEGAAGKKLGPLPMGVWALAIGAGLFFAFYMQKKQGASGGGNTATAPATDSGVGLGAGGWAYQPVTAQADTSTSYTTNQEWARAAISYLIGQNYDAGLSDAAIRNYIGGLQVSIQQQPLVDAALKKLGPPPQVLNPVDGPVVQTPVPSGNGGGSTNTPPSNGGNSGGLFGFFFSILDRIIPGISGTIDNISIPVNGQNYQVSGSYGNDNGSVTVVNPDGSTIHVDANPTMTSGSNPTSSPTPTHTGMRSYTVIEGDTLTTISMKMYGSSLQQNKIYNANLALIPDRDHLVVGTVLNIPE